MADAGATRPAAARPNAGRRVAAAMAALPLAMAISWAALAFVPDFADRLGPAVPQAARAAEGRAGLLTFGAVSAGALILAALLRQPIAPGRRMPRLIGWALPAGVIGLAAALALSAAAGAAVIVPIAAPAGAGALLTGLLLVLWAAFAEELLFRGVVQPVVGRAWGSGWALGLTALAFTIPHYLGGWRDTLSLLNIFAAGLWFGLLALRTGGVLAPTLAHVGWNGAEALLFGASPNPGIGAYGSVADVDLIGGAFLGGSAEGLNASITTTIVLVALIASCGRRRARSNGKGAAGLEPGQ